MDRGEELTDMDEEAETKAIEKWLRMVDKPLATKEAEKKDAEPKPNALTCKFVTLD